MQETLGVFGQLLVVVDNAGISRFGDFERIKAAEFRQIVDTCVNSVV